MIKEGINISEPPIGFSRPERPPCAPPMISNIKVVIERPKLLPCRCGREAEEVLDGSLFGCSSCFISGSSHAEWNSLVSRDNFKSTDWTTGEKMNRQQAFEAIYAKQHDVPAESLVQYRFESKEGYSLPMIASHYRTYCDALDSIVVECDQLKAEVERLNEDYDKAWRHDLNDKNNVQVLAAEVVALRSQVVTLQSDANSWQPGYDEGRRAGTKTALDEREQLRREIASLKPSPVRTDKTTIGYTGCIICGQYTDHGGLQCPNLAARSLSMENQRIVPVEPIRLDHPLDAAMRQGAKP